MLPETLRPVWAEMNMKNAAFNIRQIQKRVGHSKIVGIIKANAYGHGALEYARMLLENGVEKFGVATLSEAIALREGGITNPIVLLGLTPELYLPTVLRYDLTPVISTDQNAKALSDLVGERKDGPFSDVSAKDIWIAVDTGMGRVGFLPDQSGIQMIEEISKLPHIKIQALFSHFASADETDKTYAHKQLSRFNEMHEALRKRGLSIPARTMANSAGIIDLPESHMEEVRPGIILYGCYPSDEVNKENVPLLPVMTVKANITLLKTVPKGTSISYGCIFTTERESVIATLPLGYADGYPRALTGKARAIIKGQYVPIVGKICMDQCMADVTDVPGVREGDEVILMGSDGKLTISAEELAEKTNTINYEIVSRMGNRIPRVYIK